MTNLQLKFSGHENDIIFQFWSYEGNTEILETEADDTIRENNTGQKCQFEYFYIRRR